MHKKYMCGFFAALVGKLLADFDISSSRLIQKLSYNGCKNL